MLDDYHDKLKLAVAPAEAARMLSLGKTRFYELLSDNQIASIKLGSRRLIRVSELEAWLDRMSAEA